MVISFMVEEARNHLNKHGFVYTLRPYKRKRTGRDWCNYFRCDTKKADVMIGFLGEFSGREQELLQYTHFSGFNSLSEWLDKAKNSRYLYRVEKVKNR
jgi:hypothetical protein